MLDASGRALRDALLKAFAAGPDQPPGPGIFEELALRVHAYSFDRVSPYRAYCRARDREPGSIRSWVDVPAVPTAAFKELSLLAEGASPEVVFRTSGTTRGPERRGEHLVPDLSLYRASLRPTFAASLLPDGARLPFLSLMPPPSALPDSSLAFMIDDVMAELGDEGTACFAGPAELRYAPLEATIEAAVAERTPVLLLGTSAAFIHWLDRLTAAGRSYRLPEGSRLMDTGGFKRAGREVSRADLEGAYVRRLGLHPWACVNEYGMTELLSQLYDTSLRDRVARRDGPVSKRGAWWIRSVAVDPDTLEPVPPGEPGLLRHFDLANLGSVPAVQTEDLGRVDEEGLILLGRAPGAPPRGCSIAMDLLLAADS